MSVHSKPDLEPLFSSQGLFERMTDATEWTTFECDVLLALMNSESANALTFIEKVALVEAMRQAGVLMLDQIEDRHK